MNLIGKLSVSSWKKTVTDYLESLTPGLVETPTRLLQWIKYHTNQALTMIGLVKPELPMWSSFIQDTPLHLLILAAVMTLFTGAVITKLMIRRKNKKILLNLRGLMQEINNGPSDVDGFLNVLSNENHLPYNLDNQDVRGLLKLFEKFKEARGPRRGVIIQDS